MLTGKQQGFVRESCHCASVMLRLDPISVVSEIVIETEEIFDLLCSWSRSWISGVLAHFQKL